jgi:hypothetical protein
MLDDCAKKGRGGAGTGLSDLGGGFGVEDLGMDRDVELDRWLEVDGAPGLMARKWKSCRVDRLALHSVFPSGWARTSERGSKLSPRTRK